MIKKLIHLPLLFLFLIFLQTCSPPDQAVEPRSSPVPTMEEMSGDWVSADTIAMEPSIRNFRGQALVNRDMTSISWFASAPYSGGYHTGVFRVDGEVPKVSSYRWQPYQALRKGSQGDLHFLSSTRMIPEEDGILWNIEISNAGDSDRTFLVEQDMIGFISKYGGDWQWWYPYPTLAGKQTDRTMETEVIRNNLGKGSQDTFEVEELIEGKPTGRKTTVTVPTERDILSSKKYSTSTYNNGIVVSDTETNAVTGFSFVDFPDSLGQFNSGCKAFWKIRLAPGEKQTIRFVMAYDDDRNDLLKRLNTYNHDFEKIFGNIPSFWQTRWTKLFQPDNDFISGTFPVLETNDSTAKRVYYTGPLTMLYMMNTHLPAYKRIILTGGPKWGATTSFFWDNTEWSLIQAVSDPTRFRAQLLDWIAVDPAKYYGLDNFGGKGVGNPYSANYWALFQMVRAYLVATGDEAFLDVKVGDKIVLDHLREYALNWQNMSIYKDDTGMPDVYRLADFGDDEWNLLECVPTYKHIVPSFNAGYIWMLREMASLYRQRGTDDKALEMEGKADLLIGQLMKLYAGDGVWYSLYPKGKKIEVRHCLDFMFVGRYLAEDLDDSIKSEMLDFVYRELITDHWMRAQSLLDSAADYSDRPDHGPLGAYDGWPSGTMDALSEMGYSEKALTFYRAIEPVTHEGTWAQAHELWGKDKRNKKARVRIAERGWHARDAIAGIGMSQIMLKDFFGFDPQFDGTMITEPGQLDFKGVLHHVLYKGKYYGLTSDNGKITVTKE